MGNIPGGGMRMLGGRLGELTSRGVGGVSISAFSLKDMIEAVGKLGATEEP